VQWDDAGRSYAPSETEYASDVASGTQGAAAHGSFPPSDDTVNAAVSPHVSPPGVPDTGYRQRSSSRTPWQARANGWLRTHTQPRRIETDRDRCISAYMAAMATGCRVIAIVGPKGGVGRTTVALTAGLVLAETPLARPILVELNPDWGTVDALLGNANPRTVQDLLYHLTAVDRAGIGLLQGFVTMWGRLPVLTAPRFPGEMARLTPHDIAQVLRVLAVHYNVVILDCGASFTGRLTQFALQVADHLHVVTTPDPGAIRKSLAVVDYLASNHYVHDYRPFVTALVPDAPGVRRRVPTELTLVVNGVGPASISASLDLAQLHAALTEVNAVTALPYSVPLRQMLAHGTLTFDTLPADYRRALKSLLVATLGRLAHP